MKFCGMGGGWGDVVGGAAGTARHIITLEPATSLGRKIGLKTEQWLEVDRPYGPWS